MTSTTQDGSCSSSNDTATSLNTENSSSNDTDVDEKKTPPSNLLKVQKTICVTGVAPKTGPLNEAVARVANLDSLEVANDLIAIGAVWARMDALTEEDVLRQYDNDSDFDANARSIYADLRNYKHGTYEDTYGSSTTNTGKRNNMETEEN